MGLGITISVNGSPEAQLAQASKVEVYERLGETTYFTLSYPIDVVDGDLPPLIDSRLDPGSLIAIMVAVNETQEWLVKGPVYSQQIHFEHGGQGSSLEVRGGDNSILMDREFKSAVWANVTDGETIITILGSYGLTPDVATTNTRHLEEKHNLVQRDTDLGFIKRLARRNGCYFWITCEAELETAHFQRPQLDGDPIADLILNFPEANINSFDLTWNVEIPTSVEGKQLDVVTKNDLNGDLAKTPRVILAAKMLQDITPDTRSMHVAAPADDAGDMQARSEAALMEADWFIQARCHCSLQRLGKLIHPASLVNVRGAGSRHSGKYLVAGVRHVINAADHTMEMELLRNGWEAGTPL
jgi:hypothetical protein